MPPTHDHGSDWPFTVSAETRVITTTRVLEGLEPIRLVVHEDDEEGGWQLLCATTNRTEDGRPGCFGCMVKQDPSLIELADLAVGWQARRADASAVWERQRPKPVEEVVRETIASEGFQLLFQPPERPIWAYTIGLAQSVGQPDVIVIGLPPQVMHAMVRTLANMALAGAELRHGLRTDDVLQGMPCELRAVDPAWLDVMFMHARAVYGERPFSGLQCVWPDKQGRLPHEDGFDEALRRRQPQLENADADKAGLVPLLKALGRL